MRITDLPTPGAYVNSQKLRIEAVKAISAIELTHTGPGKAITAIAVGVAGADYIDGTYDLVITGGGGSGARATATVTAGAVASVTLLAGGSGYASAPTIALPAAAADEENAGTGATFTSTQGTVVRTTAGAKQLSDFFTACATALADYQPA
jgi:hypothetical protein